MNVTFIGTGFVGVVSAAVYASFGNQVIGLDVDENKITSLKNSKVPFYEPGLEDLLISQQKGGNLTFTTNYEVAIKDADIIMIAVGTPSGPDGQADLRYVFASLDSLAPYLKENAIVVVKSTVPPGTLPIVEARIKKLTNVKFHVASVPEFLKEGTAVKDTLHPDRVVLGANNDEVFKRLEELHLPLNAPIVKVKPESAQMAKYAANAYLATRITFVNQVADLCEKNGADIEDVISAIGLDKRIGSQYWYPGFGYGGSCFPKDVKEIAAYSRSVEEGDNLFNKINELNETRIPKILQRIEKKIGGWKGKKVAVLGLSFKPITDDMREAPANKVVPILLSKGAEISSYDPMASWKTFFRLEKLEIGHTQTKSIEEAVLNADIIFCLIEWPEIVSFDFSKTRRPDTMQWIVDARNQLNEEELKKIGYKYIGVGKQS